MAKASKSKAGKKAKARKISAPSKKKVAARSKQVVKSASRAKAARAAKAPARAAKPAAPASLYHTLTPFLRIKGAEQAIDFYKTALGATERMRMPGPGGMIMHCELVVGDSTIMLSEAGDQPETRSSVHLYIDNCDAAFDRAVSAGATVKRPLEDMFWGDRYGEVQDPFGNSWSIATHVRDVSPEEMQAAMAAMGPPPS
jgi:uncharacterized glyoxalase superfamily protein PhnB